MGVSKEENLVKVMAENEEKKSEAEELREVLGVIKDFIPEIMPQIKELIDMAMDALSGEKLGKDAASFYRSLVEAGIDEKTAAGLTKQFIEGKLSLLTSFKSLPTIRIEKDEDVEKREK